MKVFTLLGLAYWCMIPTQALEDKKNLRSLQDSIIKSKGSKNISPVNKLAKESNTNYENVLKEFTRTLQAPNETVAPTISPFVEEFTLADLLNVLLDIFVASINIITLVASLIGIEIDISDILPTEATTSSVPSLMPKTPTPTPNPTISPIEAFAFVWDLKLTKPGVQAAINSDGSLLFHFEENGNAQLYERSGNGWDPTIGSTDISDVWGTDESNLQISVAQNGKYVVAGNLDLKQVMSFQIIGNAFWNVKGETITEDLPNFGAYVDITNNGQQIMASGTSDIIVFNYRGDWQEIARFNTSDFLLGAFMDVKGEELFSYTLTSVMRYSLPNFEELPSIFVHPDYTIAQIAYSRDGFKVFALGYENMTDPSAGFERFSTEIYDLQANNTFALTKSLPSQLVVYNSMSMNGRALLTFDFTVPFTGRFTFATFRITNRKVGWEKAVTFQPDIGLDFSLECMLDNQGDTFVISANENIQAWDYADVNLISATAAPTKSASPTNMATDFPTFTPTFFPTATGSLTPSVSPSATATDSSQPSLSSSPSLAPTTTVSPTVLSSFSPTLVPSSMPSLERNLTWSKTFVDEGVEVDLSSDGKTLLLFQASGTVKVFGKDEGNGWRNIVNINNVGLIWGNLAEAKPHVVLDASGSWIVAGSEVLQQVLVFESKSNNWELADQISDSSLSDFGKFVGISNNGNYLLAGGKNGLMSYEYNNTSSTYHETGSMQLTSDDILDALFTVSGDTAFYYTETSFNHVSIPDFAALPTITLQSNVGIAQASFSANATTVLLSTYDMDATTSPRNPDAKRDEDDDYMYYGEWDRFNLYIYTLGSSSTSLQAVLPQHFAVYNSISGDGTRMVTRDLSADTSGGRFEFVSWLLVNDQWEKTGTFTPDKGKESSYDCRVDQTGFTFASSFSGLVNIWEAL